MIVRLEKSAAVLPVFFDSYSAVKVHLPVGIPVTKYWALAASGVVPARASAVASEAA